MDKPRKPTGSRLKNQTINPTQPSLAQRLGLRRSNIDQATLTRRQRSRYERERMLTRILLGSVAGIVLAVLGLIGFGYFNEFVRPGQEAYVVVNGRTITTETYARLYGYEQTNLVAQQQQLQSQLQQLQAGGGQEAQLYTQLIQQQQQQLSSQLQGLTSRVLDRVVEAELIRQEAANRNITASDAEVNEELIRQLSPPSEPEEPESTTTTPVATTTVTTGTPTTTVTIGASGTSTTTTGTPTASGSGTPNTTGTSTTTVTGTVVTTGSPTTTRSSATPGITGTPATTGSSSTPGTTGTSVVTATRAQTTTTSVTPNVTGTPGTQTTTVTGTIQAGTPVTGTPDASPTPGEPTPTSTPVDPAKLREDFRTSLNNIGLLSEAEYLEWYVRPEVLRKKLQAVFGETAPSSGEQVRARSILVYTEDDAKSIKEKLATGADFAQIATESSQDTATKDKGGDLGWFPRGLQPDIPQAVEDAAFSLQPGQVSDIIREASAFYIIKVEEKAADRPFDADTLKKVQANALNVWLTNKKKETGVGKTIAYYQSSDRDAWVRRYIERTSKIK